MQPRNVETMREKEGVGVDLENCAYLWKNPGYAPGIVKEVEAERGAVVRELKERDLNSW